MPVYIPANPYISIFDFKLQFDLADGAIKTDLSVSSLSPSGNISGITGVKLSITTPDKVATDLGLVFNPATGTFYQVYSFPFPRIQNVYMWGLYSVTATLILGQAEYGLTKTFNMCAPDGKNPYASEIQGSISLAVDCAMGTLTARGFCGYAYRQHPPISEDYNMTRYYPPEAELLPQKNLSVIPFVVDAYVGLNTVKGLNLSTYDFGDNVYAIVRIVATATKNVRCGLDMEQIFCGMTALLNQLTACNATPQDYCTAFCEINALIWTVTVGLNENKDVDVYIDRLEKLLGVECRCSACAGEKVGPTCVPVCPQVAGATAVVDATGLTLNIGFNTAGLPAGSSVNIKYRPFCDPLANPPFTDLGTQAATGGNQSASTAITDPFTYQVVLTSIMPDGSFCEPLYIVAPGTCPEVVGINTPPPPPPNVQFQADWGYSTLPVTTVAQLQSATYQVSDNFTPGDDISADYASAAPYNDVFLYMRYPRTETPKISWFNIPLNQGNIPDQVFGAAQDANYYYAFSRIKVALDLNNKIIVFS